MCEHLSYRRLLVGKMNKLQNFFGSSRRRNSDIADPRSVNVHLRSTSQSSLWNGSSNPLEPGAERARGHTTGNKPATGSAARIQAFLSLAQKNDAKQLHRLISDGIPVNVASVEGQTALHIAVMWGNPESVKVLLEQKADVNMKNKVNGATPLHIAATSTKNLTGTIDCALFYKVVHVL